LELDSIKKSLNPENRIDVDEIIDKGDVNTVDKVQVNNEEDISVEREEYCEEQKLIPIKVHDLVEDNEAIKEISNKRSKFNNDVIDTKNKTLTNRIEYEVCNNKEYKHKIAASEFNKLLKQNKQYIHLEVEELINPLLENLKLELNEKFEYIEQKNNQIQTEYF